VLLLIFVGRKLSDARTAIVAIAGTIAMFIRTVIDYVLSWDFYFS
jgi:hypothetical protein